MAITWANARAWRLRRHLLVGDGAPDAASVVGRLTSLPAWAGDPELAVAMRMSRPADGAVAAALTSGQLIRTFAFGGATHLFRPGDAGDILAIRAAGRQWERKSWRDHYALDPEDWPALRAVTRDALAGGPLTQDGFARTVTATPGFAHLEAALTDPSCTLLKALAWQGEVILGPPRSGELTLASPTGNPGWRGIAELDDAGPRAIVAYISAYGPATPDRLHHRFGAGLSAGRVRIERWIQHLGGTLHTVSVDGAPALCLTDDVSDLTAARPHGDVHLLAGNDPWISGTGTDDEHLVPPALRPLATRGRNLVIEDGVVTGTWKISRRAVEVARQSATPAPRSALSDAVARLSALSGRPDLELSLT